jgi:hypothetical protein
MCFEAVGGNDMLISLDRKYIYSDKPPYVYKGDSWSFKEGEGGRFVVKFDEKCVTLSEIMGLIKNDKRLGVFGCSLLYEWVNRPYKISDKNFNCRKL